METVGVPAPVFCLRAQGRRKAAKGPSLKDRCRARSGEARNIARMCSAEGIGMNQHVELTQLPNFRHSTPAFRDLESRSAAHRIPLGRSQNPKWPNIPSGEVASRQALQSSILRMSICNRAWSALTSVASTASAWAAIIRSSGAMVMPLVSSAARSVP